MDEEKFSNIRNELSLLMQEVATDDTLMPETALISVVSLDLARAANDYAYALAAGGGIEVAEKKAVLKNFIDWLKELD